MRKKLLIKSISIVWRAQTIAQTIIDELLVSNKETIVDSQGECDDWADLYNVGNRAIGIENIFLFDTNISIFNFLSPLKLSNDQSYGLLQDEEPTNQLFTQTILPLFSEIKKLHFSMSNYFNLEYSVVSGLKFNRENV